VTERRGGRGRDDRGPRGPRPDRDAAERPSEVEAAVVNVIEETVESDVVVEEAGE
jgi:hypothetical protein